MLMFWLGTKLCIRNSHAGIHCMKMIIDLVGKIELIELQQSMMSTLSNNKTHCLI